MARIARRLRRLDIGRLALLSVVLVATVALLTRDRWDWIFEADEAQTTGVDSEQLAVEVDDERLYRIAPGNGSVVSYEVEERLGGGSGVATGTTETVAGDIVINTASPVESRIGEIVVNVEMFDSDSSLRDKRLRHDYLESTHWPFARFAVTEIGGLDVDFADGETYPVSLVGDLTVKDITSQETFTGAVTVTESSVSAEVSAVVLSSTYGVGPINVARLAHTEDEVTLTFDLVADRVDDGTDADPSQLDTDIEEFAAPGGAFAAEVQPILEENCVSCHTTDGPGWDTLALDTAAQAAEIADDIALVTEIRFMPPWLPGGDSPAFEHDWSLDDDEIGILAAWAADGGGLDVAPETELVARRSALIEIDEDQIIGPAAGPYTSPVDDDGNPLRKDDYRCQVHEIDDPEGDGTWLTGLEFRPDQTAVVHHSIMYAAPAGALNEINAIAAEDDLPGWTCYGTSNLASDGVINIGGWAPGQAPVSLPDGYGLYLAPGTVIINQTHFHFDHVAPPDASEIVLQIAVGDETEGLIGMSGSSYLTPAEIPCTPDEQQIAADRAATIEGYVDLCLRENAIADIEAKYDQFAARLPGLLNAQCGGNAEDFAVLDGTVAHSSCDLPARHAGTIYTVLGHMHEFGDAYRMTLNPGTDDEQVLLDIPNWDFEWQLNYDPVDDIRVELGDTIRFECWWDRRRQHMPEPRYIVWNEGTIDEMCFSAVWVLPDTAEEARVDNIGGIAPRAIESFND